MVADPTRLAIMRALLRGPQTVAELNAPLQLEQTLFSHHLRALRAAGFVVAEREGRSVRYALAPGVKIRDGAIDFGCCALRLR